MAPQALVVAGRARRARRSGCATEPRSPPRPTRRASPPRACRSCAAAASTAISFGMQSAVAARAGRARPAAHSRAGHGGGRLGPRRRLRAGEPRPDLRRARGERRRLGRQRRGGDRAGARPRQRVRTRRRGGHPARPAGPERRGRSRPTTTCSPPATRSADELLAAAGYRWYEVSNWARPGAECRHNLGYWQRRQLVGRRPRCAQLRRGRRHTGCAGGTSASPPPTRPGSRRATAPRPPANCSGPPIAASSALMLEVRLRAGLAEDWLDLDDATRRRAMRAGQGRPALAYARPLRPHPPGPPARRPGRAPPRLQVNASWSGACKVRCRRRRSRSRAGRRRRRRARPAAWVNSESAVLCWPASAAVAALRRVAIASPSRESRSPRRCRRPWAWRACGAGEFGVDQVGGLRR